MKSRSTSLDAMLGQLETDLVEAVLDLVRTAAAASLGNVLTRSAQQLVLSPTDPGPARSTPRSAPRPRTSRAASPRSKGSDGQLSLPLSDAASLKEDTAFAITDPSVVLAEVPLPPIQRIPTRRRRGTGTPRKPRVVAPVEAAPEQPAEPAPPPALREGEELARAVVGGGVVLRRRRN